MCDGAFGQIVEMEKLRFHAQARFGSFPYETSFLISPYPNRRGRHGSLVLDTSRGPPQAASLRITTEQLPSLEAAEGLPWLREGVYVPGWSGAGLRVRGSSGSPHTCPASLSARATNWALTTEHGGLLAANGPLGTQSHTGCLLALPGTPWGWDTGEPPGPLPLVWPRPS